MKIVYGEEHTLKDQTMNPIFSIIAVLMALLAIYYVKRKGQDIATPDSKQHISGLGNQGDDKTMNITIRDGKESDLPWINELLIEGARDGHFMESMQRDAPHLMRSVLNDGVVRIMKLRAGNIGPVTIKSELKVADIDGQPTSFVVNFIDESEVELHLAGTCRSGRRNGAFSILIDDTVQRFNKNNKVYARCYKKSSWAISAFKKAGFEHSKKGDPIELTYAPSGL